MEQSEITLLEALHRMCHHKAKRKRICFEITFDECITRKALFAKRWSSLSQRWDYDVREGEYLPVTVYGKREAVSAIMSIPGMGIYGNIVKYHIQQI